MRNESVSFHYGKKVSVRHNNRKDKNHSNKGIDVTKSNENIYYVTNTIKEFYDLEFKDAVEDYNLNQKRADRKIENYYQKIHKDNKTTEAHELIVQVGDSKKLVRDSDEWNFRKDVLDEYAKKFQERNPNLKVANMVMHLDESNPHLHIDFVPVAHYDRGMKLRPNFTRAMQEQAPELGKKFMEKWGERERNEVANIAKEHDATFERKFVGTHKYLSVPEYKKAMDEITSVKKINERVQKLTHELPKAYPEATKEFAKARKTTTDEFVQDLSALPSSNQIAGALYLQQQQSKIDAKRKQEIEKQEQEVAAREQAVAAKEADLVTKTKNVEEREQKVSRHEEAYKANMVYDFTRMYPDVDIAAKNGDVPMTIDGKPNPAAIKLLQSQPIEWLRDNQKNFNNAQQYKNVQAVEDAMIDAGNSLLKTYSEPINAHNIKVEGYKNLAKGGNVQTKQAAESKGYEFE